MPKGKYERSEKTKEKLKDNLVKARDNSPIMQTPNASDDKIENTRRQIAFAKALNEMYSNPPDRKSEKEMNQRFDDYLDLCAMYGVFPGNLNCYTALGITKQLADKWDSHEIGTTFQWDFIKKIKQIMSSVRELAAQQGNINPVLAIFYAKNYDGLKDQQDVVVTPNVIGQTDDATTLAEKYRDNLPELDE